MNNPKPTQPKDTIWDAMAGRYEGLADYTNPTPTLTVNGHKKETSPLELVTLSVVVAIHKRLGCIVVVNDGRHVTLAQNTTLEEDKERARQLGRKAYIDNKCCLAQSDKELTSLLEGYSDDERAELCFMWDDGWITAAAEALSSSLAAAGTSLDPFLSAP